MLTEVEVERIVLVVSRTVDQKWLRRMFKETRAASEENVREFVRLEFESQFESLIQQRPKITLPTAEQLEEETLRHIGTMTVDIDRGDTDRK